MCIGHGGGKRCTHEGCDKSARGGTGMCVGHGGGKRCSHEGCDKSALRGTAMCRVHDWTKRWTHEGYANVGRGETAVCVGHGEGKRWLSLLAEGERPTKRIHSSISSEVLVETVAAAGLQEARPL